MTGSAARLPWPLVDEIRRLARGGRSTAEICRETGAFAASRGFQRPSYEKVRLIVRRERALHALPGIAEPLVEGWLRARSPANAVDEAFRRAEARRGARLAIESERAWRPDGGDAAEEPGGTGPK